VALGVGATVVGIAYLAPLDAVEQLYPYVKALAEEIAAKLEAERTGGYETGKFAGFILDEGAVEIPESWPAPPGWNNKWEAQHGSRKDTPASWRDPNGAEWVWHPENPSHPGHWDYKGTTDIRKDGENVTKWRTLDENGNPPQ
jgi:hypothetical protein